MTLRGDHVQGDSRQEHVNNHNLVEVFVRDFVAATHPDLASHDALGLATDAELTASVAAAVSALVDASPATLNTLNELAAALGDDPNFATTITALIGTKATPADITAAIAALSDTYAVVNKPRLRQPTHLRRWAAKRDTAFTALLNIAAVGDSLTAGAYASTAHDSTATSKNQWRDWGWPGVLRSLFARDFGYPGLGISTFLADEPAFATSGSPATASSIGPMQSGYSLTTGQTLTLYTAPCTALDIIAWWTTGAGQFTYTVDGGSPVTSAAGALVGGADTLSLYREQITGMANKAHTIVISGPASGTSYISQWYARSPLGTGVMVNRMGKSGATSDVLAYAMQQTNQTRMHTAMFKRPGSFTDLAIIMLGYNDGALQGSNGITPTLFRANLKTATDFVTAAGACTLLVAAPRSSNESSPFTQQNYYDKALDLATTDDHVAYLDMADLFGTFAQALAVGYQSVGDVIHPTAVGHAAIAQAIYRAITQPGITNA